MITQTRRDPWRAIWQVVTGDRLLVALLLAAAAGLVVTAWLPQIPAADPVAYAQWLSETQARFGEATPTLRTLGLFTITHSLGFRALLSLLAGCLLLRLIEGGGRLQQHQRIARPAGEWRPLARTRLPKVVDDLRRRRYRVSSDPDAESPLFQADRWPWADWLPLLAHAGTLLLLIGLLVTHLWGWQVEGLIVQGGKRVTLPGTEEWIALDEDARNTTHSPGIVTYVEERTPGVEVAAFDIMGSPLSLQRPSEANPVTQLTVALTEDQYFAIPEAQLVIRLAAQPSHTTGAHSPVLVQVYRSPPGRLTTEAVVEGGTKLTVGDVTLELASVPYARITGTFNPGLWPSSAGIVLLIAGLLGSIARPVRRFWLRERKGIVETTGDLPTMLAGSEED